MASEVTGSKLMSDYVFVSKYAKYDETKMRRETFEESVDRMLEMHLGYYESKLSEDLKKEVVDAFSLVKQKRLLASQRTLQFAGEGMLKHHMRGYNCAVSYCDRLRFFSEAMYMLLCGCGVGFSVQKHHVNKLPRLISSNIHNDCGPIKMHYIEDTIEGWSDAIDALIRSYHWRERYDVEKSIPVIFNFDSIRPKGAKLSSGGRAPGPEPLRRALGKIEEILYRAIHRGSDKLSPIDCYDIVMHASDAVLSGGVRRSATICLFSPDDEEMMSAKTGNWFNDNPQRGRSNNSAVLVRKQDGKTSAEQREQFASLFEKTKSFGEPGFCFVESSEYLYNPCVEIGMCPVLIKDSNGKVCESYTLEMLDHPDLYKAKGYTYQSGWQVCNLTEINAAVIKNNSDFEEVVKAAALIGSLQAGYTSTNYLGKVSQEIIEREALLGVSMTGMTDNPTIAFDYPVLSVMANLAVSTNKKWAKILGINEAARVTCIKPAGTTTITLGVGGSGCHAIHAPKMIRRVQANQFDPIYEFFKQKNPHLCEASVWSANGTDDVIMFPVEAPPGAIFKADITALTFLEYVMKLQNSWVKSGTARPDSCVGLSHNVSNTCVVGRFDWDDVQDYLWMHKEFFSGVSLISESGDFIYDQAPMQKIWTHEELVRKFGALNVGAARHIRRFIDKKLGGLRHSMVSLKLVAEGSDTREFIKSDESASFFWEAYTQIRSLIHLESVDDLVLLLSAVTHEELWNKLVLNLNKVDFTEIVESVDITEAVDQIACAGGKCEI